MTDQDIKTIEAMEKYGGSFVKALAVCFRKADPVNFAKLRQTFKKYWEDYRKKAGF
jgi:pyruvate/2-oxoacid:ferredoxin oxidoreductase beta subunit